MNFEREKFLGGFVYTRPGYWTLEWTELYFVAFLSF